MRDDVGTGMLFLGDTRAVLRLVWPFDGIVQYNITYIYN